MTTKKMWIVGLATTVMIAMLLLAGTPSVAANDQPSEASADVKIDNFSFGPETLTVFCSVHPKMTGKVVVQ